MTFSFNRVREKHAAIRGRLCAIRRELNDLGEEIEFSHESSESRKPSRDELPICY